MAGLHGAALPCAILVLVALVIAYYIASSGGMFVPGSGPGRRMRNRNVAKSRSPHSRHQPTDKPICSCSVLRQYFRHYEYFPGEASWYSKRHQDPLAGFEPGICSFTEIIVSVERLQACLQREKIGNIIVMGDSNGRKPFIAAMEIVYRAVGGSCRISKMQNYFNESDMDNNAATDLGKSPQSASGALQTALSLMGFSDASGKQTDLGQGFHSEDGPGRRFYTRKDYFSGGDEAIKRRMRTSHVTWLKNLPSVQVVCERPDNRARLPRDLTMEFLPIGLIRSEALVLRHADTSQSARNESQNSTKYGQDSSADNYDEFIWKFYLRHRENTTTFIFMPAKHVKCQIDQQAEMIEYYVDLIRKYRRPDATVFLIPDFGEMQLKKSALLRNRKYNGLLATPMIDKVNHYMFQYAKDMLIAGGRNDVCGFFDMLSVAKGVPHWYMDGAHLVPRWYQVVVSYLLQLRCGLD